MDYKSCALSSQGRWACHKLECLEEFLGWYSQNFPGSVLLVPFAGSKARLCAECSLALPSLEQRAAKIGFRQCVFMVQSETWARDLASTLMNAGVGKKSTIVTGNPGSRAKVEELLDLIPRSASSLAIVDPGGYRRLRWTMVKRLALQGKDWRGHRMDLLIVLPVEMGLVRNLGRPECEAVINRFFGNSRWQEIKEKRQRRAISTGEASEGLIKLYQEGLKEVGYRYVQSYKAGQLIYGPSYHVFYASDISRSARRAPDIWTRPRYLPCELFYKG